MNTSINKRWLLWLVGLAISLFVVFKSYTKAPSKPGATGVIHTASVPHHSRRVQPPRDPPTILALDQLKRSRIVTGTTDLFRSMSWHVAPPPAPVLPPPAPTAPPLPFSFLGKVKEPNGKLTLFISDSNRVYLVHGGETIGGNYHVDGIENGRLALTYLPMKKKQYLDLVEGQ